MRSGVFFFLLTLIVIVSACSDDSSLTGPSPFWVKVPHQDRQSFREMMQKDLDTRFDAQVQHLKNHHYNLQYFDSAEDVSGAFTTAHILYFDADNYVVGECSGAIIDHRYVATAGHCNPAGLNREGAICDGRVVIAYRISAAKPVQYARCGTVRVHVYTNQTHESTNEGQGNGTRSTWKDIQDYSLYELKNPEFVSNDGPFLTKAIGMSERGDLRDYALKGKQIVSLAVDPFTSYENMAAKYKVISGEIRERIAPTWNVLEYYESNNSTIPGNSGAPIYVKGENPMTYLAPIYGYIWSNSERRMASTLPDGAVNKFRAVIYP